MSGIRSKEISKTRVDEESAESGGSGKVKSVKDATKLPNEVIPDARKGGNLFEER